MCHLGRVLSAEDGGLEAAARLMSAAATRSEIDIEAVQRTQKPNFGLIESFRTPDERSTGSSIAEKVSVLTCVIGRFFVPPPSRGTGRPGLIKVLTPYAV